MIFNINTATDPQIPKISQKLHQKKEHISLDKFFPL
mgnify:CR=1 FL=1